MNSDISNDDESIVLPPVQSGLIGGTQFCWVWN